MTRLHLSSRTRRGLLVLSVIVCVCAIPAWAQQTGGPHWPVHGLDLGLDQQSLVLRLFFDGPTNVSLESARVVAGRTFGRRADPPLLRLQLSNAQAVVLEQFNAWHPLWTFSFDGPSGVERRVIRPSGSAQFVMPFRPDLARIAVDDVRLAVNLITVRLADLAVERIDAVGVPPDVVIGDTFNVTVESVVSNQGPATPMDLRLTTSATASAGIEVVPVASNEDALALHDSEQRTLTQTFAVTCRQPGAHGVSFAAAAAPLSASDADLHPANNQAATEISVDCVVPVAINIRPGGFPNSTNVNDASVSVAVLTTAAGEYGLPIAFDATTIRPLTVRFGEAQVVFTEAGGGPEIHQRGHSGDERERSNEKTRDGDIDMLLHFEALASGLFVGQGQACVKGRFVDPVSNGQFKFFGCDSISVVP